MDAALWHKKTLDERFHEKVMPVPESGCWLWVGSTNSKNGYGYFGVGSKNYLAHRVSYQMHVGHIADGLQIDHLCKVRCCVNPAHLEAVTAAVNFNRGVGRRNGARFQSGKTHCVNGHEFNSENTSLDVAGRRTCRVCWRTRARKYRKDRKNAQS